MEASCLAPWLASAPHTALTLLISTSRPSLVGERGHFRKAQWAGLRLAAYGGISTGNQLPSGASTCPRSTAAKVRVCKKVLQRQQSESCNQ
eukprot:366377-Chlamydomonas_euryale.AAC.7